MSPDVSNMIDALDSYQSELYPAESNHLDSRQTLSEPKCKFLGAYRENELVGIGAVKMFDDYGELKRFFVPPSLRGNGIAELIFATLEFWLIENGVLRSHLETGIHQHAALRFYEKLGYRKTGPFGSYKDDPLSVFMTKDLSNAEILSNGWKGPFNLIAFSSHLNKSSARYHSLGDEMVRLAREQDGFIGVSSIRNEDGSGFTASYWRNLEAIDKWRKHPRHLEAQKLGREEFYQSFRTSLAQVELGRPLN